MLLLTIAATSLLLQGPAPLDVSCDRTKLGSRPLPASKVERVLGHQRACRLRVVGEPTWQAFRYSWTTADTLVVRIAEDDVRQYDWSEIGRIDRRVRLGPIWGTLLGLGLGASMGAVVGGLVGEECSPGQLCFGGDFIGFVLGGLSGLAVGAAGLSWIPRWQQVYCAE